MRAAAAGRAGSAVTAETEAYLSDLKTGIIPESCCKRAI